MSSAATTSAAAGNIGRLTVREQKHEQTAKQGRRAKELNEDDENEDMTFRPDSPFPWHAVGVACTCGGVYYKFSNVVAVGSFVPIVNGVFFVGLATFAFLKLRAAGDTSPSSDTAWVGNGRGGRGSGVLRRKNSTTRRNTYLFG